MSTNLSQAETKAEKLIPGIIRMISGCKDEQTSADVSSTHVFQLPTTIGPGGAGGACSNSFASVSVADANQGITWCDLLSKMRSKLQQKQFEQIPQVTSSRVLPLDSRFKLVGDGGVGKKAVFVGINYVGQQGELRGCHNDVDLMQSVITKYYGMGSAEMKILRDDGRSQNPTKSAILNAFNWLVDGAKQGDCLFFHYSGHGGFITDSSGDEKDRRDETIVPVDFEDAGQITDDELFQIILRVPADVTLTIIMDCCHSGSVFDLPFVFLADESHTSTPSPQMTVNPNFSWEKVFKIGMKLYDMHQRGSSMKDLSKTVMEEFQKDPSLQQGLKQEFSKFTKSYFGGSSTTTGQTMTTTAATAPPPSSKPPSSFSDAAKFGASLLLAANEAGSSPNPAATFSSFLGKSASKFF